MSKTHRRSLAHFMYVHTDTQLVEKEGKARILAVQTAVSRGSTTMSQQGKTSKLSVLPDPRTALDHTSRPFRWKNGAEKLILDLHYT